MWPVKHQYLWLLVLMRALLVRSTELEWSSCPSMCTCKWNNGKKQASCEDQKLDHIPKLSEEIQTLVLDNNRIHVIENDVFCNQRMINLQKLNICKSEVSVVEKNAFRNLSIIIDIDLSHNKIRKLDASTFDPTEKLRWLYLNDNSIEKIEDGLFSNLKYLQVVELNDNQISYVSVKAFVNLPVLQTLKLNGNRLKQIKLSVFDNLNLRSLELKNNPWKCDCHMRRFITWFNEHNLYTHPTTCDQPDYLKDAAWNNISANVLACKPEIVSLVYRLDEGNERLLLSCKVRGDPKPEAYITFNARTLSNSTLLSANGERKYTSYEYNDNEYRYNVTVHKINRQDHGVYICVAKNAAGLVETNITFTGESTLPFFPFVKSNVSDVWLLLLCLVIGIICALVLIFMLCFLCCRRVDRTASKKQSNVTVPTNGDLTRHTITEPEQQKTLLTAVNPVQKPPRKYDSPQFENDGTELTELNRNLLDDNSVLGGVSGTCDSMDDRRSTNSFDQLSSCNSQDNLLLQERFRPLGTRTHPPDLLAFPSRRLQPSPVGSFISNDPEAVARFHAMHSPVRSPIYEVHSFTPSYETLPHARTHSPFGPTGAKDARPIIAHRQGYVTIPRRPRIPSWSSAPTPTIEDVFHRTEPVYDNLGLRTTADGSSVLSLPRRVSAESSPRVQTSSPLYANHTLPHKTKLMNHVYMPIRGNQESPSFPCVREHKGVVRPEPLQLTPNGEADGKRCSWATPTKTIPPPGTGTLKKTSIHDLNGTSTLSPPPPSIGKVAPEPPPKPKKDERQFEDEGEDGTEV